MTDLSEILAARMRFVEATLNQAVMALDNHDIGNAKGHLEMALGCVRGPVHHYNVELDDHGATREAVEALLRRPQ